MHGNNGINGRGLQPVASTTSRLNDQQPADSKVFGRAVVTVPANSWLNVTLDASCPIQVNILNRRVTVIIIGKPYIPRPISSEARQILFERGTAALEEKGYSPQEAAVLAKKGMSWAESSFGSGSSQIENKFTGWINNAPQRADNRSLQKALANAELKTEIPAPPSPPPLPKVSKPSISDEDGVLLARSEPVEREKLSQTAAKPSMGNSVFIRPTEPLRENNLDDGGKALTKEREQHKETTASGGLDDLTGVRELFTETEDVSERAARKNTDTTTPTQITQDRENTESNSSAAKENLPSNEIPASTNAEVDTEIPTPPPPPPLPNASVPSNFRNDAKDTAESATNAEEADTTLETTNGGMQQAITDDVGNSSLDDETQNIRAEAPAPDNDGVLTARPKSPERENISQPAGKQSMGKPGFIQPIEPLWENNLDEDVNGSTDDKNADNTSPASTNPEVNTEIPTPPTPPPLPKASIPLTSRNDAKGTAESATNAEEAGTTIETTNGAMQQAITDDIGNSSLDDETQNIRTEASTSDENGVLTARPNSADKGNISPTAVKQSMGKPDFIQPIEPLRENNLDEDVNGSTDDKNANNTSPASTNPKVNTEIPPPPKASRPSTPRNDAKDMGELATNTEDIDTTIETTNGVMPPITNDDDTRIIKSKVVTTSDEDGVSTARSKAAEREKNLEQASTTQLKEGKQFKETKARGGIDDLTGVRELFTEPKDSGGLNDLTGITRLFTTNKSAASGRLQESTALNVTNKLAKDKQTVPAKEYIASDIHKNTTIIRKKAETQRETSPPQASQPKKTTRAKRKLVADSSASRKGPKIINRGLDLSGVESSKYARLSNQKTTASAGSKAHQQMVNDRKLLGVYSTSNELNVARSTYKKLQDNLSNLPQSKKIIDVARKYLSENPIDQKPLLSEPNSSQLAALESLGLEESATEKIILMAMVDKASESIGQNKQYQHENFMKSLAKVHKVLFGKS